MKSIYTSILLLLFTVLLSFGQETIPFPEDEVKIEKVYPNPVSTHIYIEINQNEYTQAKFELVDILGNKIQKWEVKRLAPGSQRVKLTFKSLRTGIYILKIKVGTKIFIKRIKKS